MSRYQEKNIAIEAVKIVEEYGEISMTDLRKELTRRMNPDGHDLEINPSRGDTYFSQKVRNLRSHKNKIFFNNVYFSEEKQMYISKECIELKEVKSNAEYKKILKKKRERVLMYYARKIDYERLNREKKVIGDKGELLVLNDQKEKVNKFAPEYVNGIRHVSKQDGDGTGYDILSFDESKRICYLEVKSTTGEKETPFYMSVPEYSFYELHKDNYLIARVYDLNIDKMQCKIEYIKGVDFEAYFEKEVYAYRILFKK